MKKSAYYSDLFFVFSLTAFCALFLFRFLGVWLVIAVFPSLIFGGICAFLLSIFFKKKQHVFALKKSEEQEKENLFFYLGLAEQTEIKNFLAPRLPILIKNLSFELESIPKGSQSAPAGTIVCEGYFFLPIFLFRELTPDDVANVIKALRGLPNAILLCDKLSKETIEFCEKLSLKTIQGDFLYRTFKDENLLPKELPIKLIQPKRNNHLSICFAKTNSKRFFKSGIALSVCSFFTPYSVYYTIFACLFFSLSVLIRVFGYR